MNIRNRDILNCFPLLASVLGNRYGVEIRIGGDQALTNGNIIYIPAMPAELDNETLEAAKGYVDHESAHIRYTDFEAVRSLNLQKPEQWLWNAIEDWRVEKKLAEIFPGCKQNFQRLINRMFGAPTRAGRKNPALVALDYVLLSVRSWEVPAVSLNKNQTGDFLDKNLTGLRDELDGLLMAVQQTCSSTVEAIIHAQKIGSCIRKYFSGSGHGKQDDFERDFGQEAKPNDPNSDDKCPNSETQANTDKMEKTLIFKTGVVDEPSQENPHSQESDISNAHDLDELLSEDNEDLPQNLGTLLSRKLENCATDENSVGVRVATTGNKKVSPFSAEEKMEALRDSVALRQRLSGLLQARTLRQCGIGRHGKLHSSSLHRICVGNARGFRRETERIAQDVAVHILLDCSYSMDRESMSIARKACYAIIKSLANIKGINLALTAFPAENQENSVYPAIRHGQGMKTMPSFDAYGDTPLGPALWWVLREMLPLPENRKIIFILTDGVPNSVPSVMQPIAQAKKLKMEVMGIGIQSTAVSHLLPKSSKVIWQLNELAPAMFELMQTALLKGGQK